MMSLPTILTSLPITPVSSRFLRSLRLVSSSLRHELLLNVFRPVLTLALCEYKEKVLFRKPSLVTELERLPDFGYLRPK
jgi:hypothetical protein